MVRNAAEWKLSYTALRSVVKIRDLEVKRIAYETSFPALLYIIAAPPGCFFTNLVRLRRYTDIRMLFSTSMQNCSLVDLTETNKRVETGAWGKLITYFAMYNHPWTISSIMLAYLFIRDRASRRRSARCIERNLLISSTGYRINAQSERYLNTRATQLAMRRLQRQNYTGPSQ